MADFFVPGVASGLRYDDPKLALNWPLPVSVIAAKDLELPVLP
jgi:dTDP-4-dehydrorhamnose 3,5-epimerase